MKDNKIKAKPFISKAVEEFIFQAEKRKMDSSVIEYKDVEDNLPWLDKSVRSDIQKVFTSNLSEEYILKIKYLSEKTNISQQKIIRKIISTGVDKMLNEI